MQQMGLSFISITSVHENFGWLLNSKYLLKPQLAALPEQQVSLAKYLFVQTLNN
jgi:hypothetical protein